MRRFWIFNIGTGTETPAEDWMVAWPHHTYEMWFPPNKKPTGITVGDRAVIHGSGGRGFFAVVEVSSIKPETNEPKDTDTPKDLEERKRWPWIRGYKLLVAIRADRHAPSLEDVGWRNPKRLHRNPHVQIDRETYDRISRAITAGATEAVAV